MSLTEEKFLTLIKSNLPISSFMECAFGATELLSGSWPHLAFFVAKGGRMTKFWSTEYGQDAVLKVSCCTSSAPSSSLFCLVSWSGVVTAGEPSWPSRLQPCCRCGAVQS